MTSQQATTVNHALTAARSGQTLIYTGTHPQAHGLQLLQICRCDCVLCRFRPAKTITHLSAHADPGPCETYHLGHIRPGSILLRDRCTPDPDWQDQLLDTRTAS